MKSERCKMIMPENREIHIEKKEKGERYICSMQRDLFGGGGGRYFICIPQQILVRLITLISCSHMKFTLPLGCYMSSILSLKDNFICVNAFQGRLLN